MTSEFYQFRVFKEDAPKLRALSKRQGDVFGVCAAIARKGELAAISVFAYQELKDGLIEADGKPHELTSLYDRVSGAELLYYKNVKARRRGKQHVQPIALGQTEMRIT